MYDEWTRPQWPKHKHIHCYSKIKLWITCEWIWMGGKCIEIQNACNQQASEQSTNIWVSIDWAALHEPSNKLPFLVVVDDTATMPMCKMKTGLIKESESSSSIINFMIVKIMFDCASQKQHERPIESTHAYMRSLLIYACGKSCTKSHPLSHAAYMCVCEHLHRDRR